MLFKKKIYFNALVSYREGKKINLCNRVKNLYEYVTKTLPLYVHVEDLHL